MEASWLKLSLDMMVPICREQPLGELAYLSAPSVGSVSSFIVKMVHSLWALLHTSLQRDPPRSVQKILSLPLDGQKPSSSLS